MKTIPKTQGGKREGSGRKALQPGLPSKQVSLRLNEFQHLALQALGGQKWIRDQLDTAYKNGIKAAADKLRR